MDKLTNALKEKASKLVKLNTRKHIFQQITILHYKYVIICIDDVYI